MKPALFLLLLIFTHSSPANDEQMIKGYGEFKSVENPTFKSNESYKVVFDVYTSDDDLSKLNRGINTVARFINMHLDSGVKKENLDIALVLHGKAGKDILNNTKYQQKFNLKNPNEALINELNKFGVQVIVCGQTLGFNQYQRSDILANVKVSLSAMSALLSLQQSGYSLINFN
jgi:intracellular sulfur oxidation DsrE/DsrF family protein